MTFPFASDPQNKEEYFMREALKEAWKAFQLNEVPIGAVLVKNEEIISRGYNQVELLNDATAHAEMICIKGGQSVLQNWRLSNTTLYCTLEPCSMCAGALLLSRISSLVWGAPDIRHGANGSWVDLFQSVHPTHQVIIRKGILQKECGLLLKNFFWLQRKKKRDKIK